MYLKLNVSHSPRFRSSGKALVDSPPLNLWLIRQFVFGISSDLETFYSLASSVHKFYNEHKIIGLDNQNQYLKVLSMVALSIRTGLKVLGINAKEVM